MMFPIVHGLLDIPRPIAPPTLWDLDTVSPDVNGWTLFNSGATARYDSPRSVIRAIPGKSSGKLYYEMQITGIEGQATPSAGLAQDNFEANPSTGLPTGNYLVWRRNSQVFTSLEGYKGTTGAYTDNTIIGFAVNLDESQVTLYVEGLSVSIPFSIESGGMWYPAADAQAVTNASYTLFTKNNELQYLPSGFTAWAEG